MNATGLSLASPWSLLHVQFFVSVSHMVFRSCTLV
jgi:hypothetical protein